jgi:chemotaxis protein MotB
MKRTKKANPDDHGVDAEGSWAISYGDLITLLLGFFVLFFSVDPDKDKQKTLMNSSVSALQVLSTSQGRIEESWSGDLVEQPIATSLGATVHQIGQKIYIDFPGISFFRSGGTDLTADGQDALSRFVTEYLPYAGHHVLNVVGFTDERPIRISRVAKDNWELSVLRALAAQRLMRSKGIPLASMRIAGHGVYSEKLSTQFTKDSKEYLESLAQARRVVLIIEPEVAHHGT